MSCQIENCDRKVLARGWCSLHYKRWYANGDPLVAKCAPNGDKVKHPLYYTYTNILTRCYNENSVAFPDYGGRGVGVCSRWLGMSGFDNFVADMGERPDKSYSIDRIDNNKGYEPSNCHWTTKTYQALNRRMRSDNKSGYPGISGVASGKWKAVIKLGGKRFYLGTFAELHEAVAVRVKAEEALFKPILEGV